MELLVKANKFTDDAIISDLSVDDAFECYALEPEYREEVGQPVASWKVKGRTAIPAGRYPITINFSDHFQKDLIEVMNVPGFDGIRIHGGNKPADTEGCTVTGEQEGDDEVTSSQAALAKLQPKVQAALDAGEEVWITYDREGHP